MTRFITEKNYTKNIIACEKECLHIFVPLSLSFSFSFSLHLLFSFLSVHPFINVFVHSFIHLSFIYLFVHLSIYPFIDPFTYSSIHSSIRWFQSDCSDNPNASDLKLKTTDVPVVNKQIEFIVCPHDQVVFVEGINVR